jgi:hypothetical protein
MRPFTATALTVSTVIPAFALRAGYDAEEHRQLRRRELLVNRFPRFVLAAQHKKLSENT